MEKVLRAVREERRGGHLLVQRQFACLSGSLCHCPLVPFDCVLSNCGSNKLEEATIRNILHALQRSLPLHLSLSRTLPLSLFLFESAPSVSLSLPLYSAWQLFVNKRSIESLYSQWKCAPRVRQTGKTVIREFPQADDREREREWERVSER